MNDIYLISGLAADERVFQFLDFHGRKTIAIPWIPPLKGESIESYASRLLPQITSPKPILIGLSFGGMMAVEVAKQIETEKVIIISSAKNKNEIPFYFKVAGRLQLDKLLPTAILKRSHLILSHLFGPQNKSAKQLFKSIIQDSEPVFTKWAIRKVVTWQNEAVIKNLYHIHGTADKTLPIRFVRADKTIKGGEHFMIVDKADEVSKAINEIL